MVKLRVLTIINPSHLTIPVSSSNYVASFCQDSVHRVSATANLSRDFLGRILSTWVAGLAGAGLTWLTGFVDSQKVPTSTDTSGGSPVLACVSQCHGESGGVVIACLCLSLGLSVGLLLPAAKPDGPRSADVPENPVKASPEVCTPAVKDQTQEVSIPFRRVRRPP